MKTVEKTENSTRNAHATVEIIVEDFGRHRANEARREKFPSLVGPDSERVCVCFVVEKLRKNELKSLDRDYFVK